MSMLSTVFRNLPGRWQLRRKLDSVLPEAPSGTFEGIASFTARKPTAHSIASELLYHEQGELKMENGITLTANRKYIYRYNKDEDKVSVWFVTEDSKQNNGNEEVDRLFHDLEMKQETNGWVGRGEHLCDLDMYWAYYEFRLGTKGQQADSMDVFGVRYKVWGPDKDYTSDSGYTRLP